MEKLAKFAIRRRWWIIAAWVVAVIAIQALLGGVGGTAYKDNYSLPGTETQKVVDLFKAAKLDQQNHASGDIVLKAKSGTLQAEPAGFVEKSKASLCADAKAHVQAVTTPWGSYSCQSTPTAGSGQTGNGQSGSGASTARPDLLSPDKSVAIVEVTFDSLVPTVNEPKAVFNDIKTLRSDSLQIEFTGDVFSGVDASAASFLPVLIGFVAAIIILIFAFRSIAAFLPIISAIAALGSGLGLMGLLSHTLSVASWAPQLAELMVIGVGIDYALFVVTRHRRNLMAGMEMEQSIVNALNTAGRAVLFAGITVCIAILGLCALGVSFLYGVAITTSIGVALTMIASITLLPAMMRFMGLRILTRRNRLAVKAGEFKPVDASGSRWYSWARLIEKRSAIFAVFAAAVIIVIAIPFFSMRLGHADQSNDPSGSTTRKGYDIIQTAYGKGYNSLLSVVVDGPQATDKAYLQKVTQTLASTGNVNKESVTAIPATNNIAIIGFKSISGPQDEATTKLVGTLRNKVIPPLNTSTTTLHVAGSTAASVDFTKVLASKMIYFILAVVGLSFILLMVAFRSIVIPATAAVMNLLAAGASFGVVVAIFQWGWFGDAIGVGAGGPVEAFLPVIFFSILFGLSMDYQVFLVSRMHEEWIHTQDNHRAVTVGQGETGGIITAAGLIMITVFAGFILGDQRFIKLMGIGLASAIFLDAFVVRTMLVPSIMHRLGKWNWWYPSALDRITPRVSIEPAEDHEGAETERSTDNPELSRV